MLLTHDFPDPTAHSPRRQNTTTALQGLYALNGPLLLTRSAALSKRLHTDIPGESPDLNQQRIERVYQLLFARQPTSNEVAASLEFLGQATDAEWTQYAHVLLVSNEFLFVD